MIRLGERIGRTAVPGTVIALTGPLGAGKTTLTKGIALALGIREEVTSPTFTIISEYEGKMPLYHMDLYRIGGTEEFELTGAPELLDADGVSVIEWSEKATGALPRDAVRIYIGIREGGGRTVEIEGIDP